ncbi:MAG: hypothetical protein WC679_12310 [Bacteroidales bacterium]|jgi:hypothetical protein
MKTQDEIYKEIVKEDNQTFVKGYKHGKEQTLKEVFEEIDKLNFTQQYDDKNKFSKKDEGGYYNEVIDKKELKTKLQEKFK